MTKKVYTLAERLAWDEAKRARKRAKNANRRISSCHGVRAHGTKNGGAYVCSKCGRVESGTVRR